MNKLYSITIPVGTKVLCKQGLITLAGGVCIDDAVREKDGSFSYYVGKTKFFVSAGCLSGFAPVRQEEQAVFYPHGDALIGWLV